MTVSMRIILKDNVSGKHETSENEHEKRDMNLGETYFTEIVSEIFILLPSGGRN
ncbi:hypothetical protein [Pleomorphomonas sp. JP5]|uniref:hypothetical protein n=1 Tax=Pleomorphomonas sp. JP5 TaxID=2942998 RepID=UPI002042E9B4|nr:hypothetical protein [Pleomorphomonas sp. JP5]MCM5559611.1 hypothetical protein [Pleomorphomonas sp. JP5]